MRVLLISSNTEHINIVPLPLGLNCVAVATRNAGHEVRLLDLMEEADSELAIRKVLASFQPDVIGISVRNIDNQSMVQPAFLLDQVKGVVKCSRQNSQAHIILGGAGYSIFPESCLTYLEADMGIQGEGEAAFPMLLQHLECGAELSGVPGLYLRDCGLQTKRRFSSNLDELPLPDEAMWKMPGADKDDFGIPVQTRRGCPMDCSYCSTAQIEGRAIRKRSPDLVTESLARHVSRGYRRFYFVDNTFNLPLAYAKDLCRNIIDKKLEISWRCIIYPGIIDEEFADLLVKSGCTEVSLGFESGCERINRILNKKFHPDSVRRTSQMLKSRGIRQLGFLMLGSPGETRESACESLAFADSLDLEAMKINIGVRIYPQTALSKIAIDHGLIHRDDNLLFPRFYIVRELENWLTETVRLWIKDRPHWMA